MPNNEYESVTKEIDELLQKTDNTTRREDYKSVVKKVNRILKKKDGEENRFKRLKFGKIKKGAKKLKTHFSIKNLDIGTKLIGLLFTTMGFVFLFNPIDLYGKIGVTLIIIGIFMIFLIKETRKTKDINGSYITLALGIWVLLMFFVTGSGRLETFFILIVLGVLMAKELTDEFTTVYLKKRLNILIFVFLIVFIVVMGERIISFLSI